MSLYDLAIDRDDEERLRHAAMSWLDARARAGEEVLSYGELAEFTFEGWRVPLMDPQRGIRKPAGMSAALSIRTRFTPPGQVPPYQDAEGPDGLLRYKYRGLDPARPEPDHPENIALREAFRQRLPLIWFVAAAVGAYVPIHPVWIVGDEPEQLQFVVAFDVAQRLVVVGEPVDDTERRYVERLTRQRLHQPVFRVRVLSAYANQCAMCRLRYTSLLDAAHILPDGHPRGAPVVPNGLSLCKMHHAAYDENLLGVRPDLVVEVRADVRDQIDGPMLRHGLQEMAGVRLLKPTSRAARPDPERLEERYEEFRRAG
ncbi:MAG: HNH endonuclease [Actinomycetota bacterium]|nr:HNH endonuclease [Actinomycetota bacterium]